MVENKFYHSLRLDIVRAKDTDRIVYLLLPEGVEQEVTKWIESASERYHTTVIAMSRMDWNDNLTPWEAEGVMKKEKPFGGHASRFLRCLHDDYFRQIESDLKIKNAERTVVGISLSGLFAVWSAFKTDMFLNIVSLSGSFWYDGFTDWVKNNQVNPAVRKIYISIGSRESGSKDRRLSTVVEDTKDIAEDLRGRGLDVIYVTESGVSHFSPATPRLDKALDAVFASSEPQQQPEENK